MKTLILLLLPINLIAQCANGVIYPNTGWTSGTYPRVGFCPPAVYEGCMGCISEFSYYRTLTLTETMTVTFEINSCMFKAQTPYQANYLVLAHCEWMSAYYGNTPATIVVYDGCPSQGGQMVMGCEGMGSYEAWDNLGNSLNTIFAPNLKLTKTLQAGTYYVRIGRPTDCEGNCSWGWHSWRVTSIAQ